MAGDGKNIRSKSRITVAALNRNVASIRTGQRRITTAGNLSKMRYLKIVPAARNAYRTAATFYVKVTGGQLTRMNISSCSRKPITIIADREAVKETQCESDYQFTARESHGH